MPSDRREFHGEADLQAMAALARECPADSGHLADWPYRLSSGVFDDPENVRLWVDAEDRLAAWAVMQTPFWTIDCVCRPGAGRDLHRQVLAWADARARSALGTAYGRPQWFVNVFAGRTDRIRDLEEAGFACQADVGEDSWSMVFMRRSAQTPVAGHALPAGFTVRPLAGPHEVEDYVALHRAAFESRNMTVEWRARTLRRPEYVPDLDLVVVAPGGRLAAFCVCWLTGGAEAPGGQVEPLGVHPDFRRLGLGRAVLAEGLRGLQRHGALEMYVATDAHRHAALALYASAGFRVVQDVLVYRKDYGNA